jgi:chemotaxis protein CheZ
MSAGSSTASSEQNLHKEDQKKLIAAIESTDKLIKNIIINISRILESLSFQDLSGQQIKKILSVLSSVQVQLLSMLVTFGVKLKKKEAYESLAFGEKEDLVHQEVDKMKSKVSDDVLEDEEEGEGPLNQEAVDDLLAELGF